MELIESLEGIDNERIKIGLTIVLILGYLIFIRIIARLINGYGTRQNITLSRIVYTIKYFRFIAFMFCLVILGIVWDVSFKGLSVYFLSFFTVAGVGLFATWSILSNITAAIILFFYFPIRIGQTVRINDGDNSIEGIVLNLTLFSIIIENKEGFKVTYPNNVALQKGIVHIQE